jgi:hypothetical protein
VVRGSAALLAGLAYLLLADGLPGAGEVAPAILGTIAVALCALSLVPARDEPVGLAVLGVGAALLAVALNERDAMVGATPVEALFGAAAGLLFAYGFAVPAAVVALPILVAGIDGASLFGAAEAVRTSAAEPDVLTLDLPAWGDGGPLPRLNLIDATFLALFAAWSLRYALRPRLAIPLMVSGLVAAVVLTVTLERSIPTLPFLALGFLLPALDRVGQLLRSEALG